MKGDFSRDTFDPLRHFSRVLVQQGRLQLDADYNEQSDILLHYLRTLAADLIGGHGGPAEGFTITAGPGQNFGIKGGRYYVDGILCENDRDDFKYKGQRERYAAFESGKNHLVYLDVWERHVTALDDESIHEVALGDSDTTTRAQVLWRVRATARNPDQSEIPQGATNWDDWLTAATGWPQWLEARRPAHRGLLKATGRAPATGDTQPCVISPEARFRGLENQLYRVEIHSEGGVTALGRVGTATFKWSRENGSVVFGVNALAGNVATVTSLGRGDRASLTANDWVELIDDELVWRDEPGILARVVSVDPDELSVTLEPRPGQSLPSYDRAGAAAVHAQLRRWDYRREPTSAATSSRPQSANDGALIVEEGKPLTLEDGVQITFSPAPVGAPYYYRSGDYWLIPARVATGDVEWRGPPAPPRGVTHHYAPLGIINVTDAAVSLTKSFRRLIKSSAAP